MSDAGADPLTEPSAGTPGEQPTVSGLRQGSFAADILKLVSGTAFGQAVTVFAMPLITRLFSPEAYGISVAFGSIGSVILVFVCLRYEQAIMLPEADDHAANLVALSLLAALVITAVMTVVFWLWGEVILGWLGMGNLQPFLWMMAPWLLVSAVLLVLNEWNARRKRFGLMACGPMVNSLTTNASCIAGGVGGHATGGMMIVATVLGTVVTLIFQGAQTLRTSTPLCEVYPTGILGVLRRYANQPLYGTWAALLNAVSWQLPIFVLTAFFSPAVAAQYALGNRVLQMPMSLVGGAIGKVFYQRAAEAHHQGTLALLAEVTFRRLVALALPPTLFLMLVGRDLFALVFGSQWTEAGVFMQLLSIWAFFWFISSPLSYLYLVLERQRFHFVWNVANFATRLGSLWIGALWGSPLLALGLFGLSGVLIYGFLALYLLRAAGVSWTRALSIMGFCTLGFLPVAIVLQLLTIASAPLWLEIGLPGTLVFLYLLWNLRNEDTLSGAEGCAAMVRQGFFEKVADLCSSRRRR